MIICSSSNIDLIQGVSGYGTAADGATDWRIENTATGVFNILNSPNLLTPNVSIIDAGNIGIGTIPVSGTNKLQVQGNLNVSGGYFVAGVAFKPATAVLADTATVLATSRNIAGVGFTGATAIDIPYFNLTNKITAGNGISLTSGSASSSPSISTNLTAGNGISISAAASPTISTNLTAGNGISISAAASPVITANITAGTNITFTGTNPISISAAGGTSQWTGNVGANIYYNSGNVGIGNSNIESSYKFKVEGSAWITNQLVFFDSFRGAGADYACNKIAFYGAGNSPTTTANNGLGLSSTGIEYFSYTNHAFYTGTTGGTGYGTERMRITSGGNVGIGTNNPAGKLYVNGDLKISANSDAWDSQAGRCLYMRYSINGGQNSSYIQSIDRNTGITYPLGIECSTLTVSANFNVSGGTKSWVIKHPILENKDLMHVCIEGTRADNLYRGRKQLVNGECEVNLDLECNTTGGMTEGTFVLINKNIQVFVNNNETFDKVVGKVVGNKIIVECDNANASCFIDWLVIGERNDNEIINNINTSSSGSVIVEIDRVVQQTQDNMSGSNTSNVF